MTEFNRVKVAAAACAVLVTAGNNPIYAQKDAGVEGVALIVQITVDGLRGDLLNRYRDTFNEDGFQRLMNEGIWFTDAHHQHANTETIVGHATLATGAHPSEHGMVGNAWFDRKDGRVVYNIEDPEYPLLPKSGFDGVSEQLDPSQATAESPGRSPRNILVSSFSDELFKSGNGASKVFSISGKDRSAVAMAGHFGKAFWMSVETGAFQTSTFYYDEYPQWVLEWNADRPADVRIGETWALNDAADTYLLLENDDRNYETDLKGFGRTFPHRYGDPSDGLYYTQVLLSALGDQLTAAFAKAAVLGENLGQDEAIDYLSISFSGVDATNHIFGPSSLENEEMVRALDRTLADLFAFLDDTVGDEKILYVLSADHGMPEMPEQMSEFGKVTYRVHNAQVLTYINLIIEEEFGFKDSVAAFFRPYLYFNHDAIAAAGVARRDIERLVVDQLSGVPGITVAMPREPFPDQRDSFVEDFIRNNFHPSRSGDIYVVQSPYSFLFDKGAVAVMHGSPWRYDTHVPVIFAGPGLSPRRVSRRIGTTDIAVTLANLFGTTQPSGASGEVLQEIMD